MKKSENDINTIKKHIIEVNFTLMIHKLVENTVFNLEQIQNMCMKYRRFLYLVYKYRKQHKLAPTKEIDLIWHNHILHTEKYINDCNKIFGKYLHHYPYSGIDGVSKKEEQRQRHLLTAELYKKEYGDELVPEKLNLIQKIVFACM